MSDKFNCPAGKRNTWYFFGSILVLPSFLGIFITTPGFLSPGRSETIWYCTLPAIFNVGWASVQIAHMSIVNQLSYSQRRRDRMVNNRNGFTYIANICVLSVSLVLFILITDAATCFSVMCISCLTFGSMTTIFYSVQITETKLTAKANELEDAYRRSLRATITPIDVARVNATIELNNT